MDRFLGPGIHSVFLGGRGHSHHKEFVGLSATSPTLDNVWTRVFVSKLEFGRATRKVTVLGIGIYLLNCELDELRSISVRTSDCRVIWRIARKFLSFFISSRNLLQNFLTTRQLSDKEEFDVMNYPLTPSSLFVDYSL